TTTALAKFQTSQKLIDLNYAAICASLYYNLSRKNLLSISNQNLLNKELSHLSVWGQENLSLFRTIINVLSPRIIYQVSYQVIEYLDFIQAAGHDTFYFAITTLFEAAIALFKANNFKYAQKILDKLNTLTFKERDMQLIIGRHFLNQLAEYHNQPNEQKIIKTISFLREIGANHLAHYFLTIFNQIK
ncbi:MAG: transcriptional regulator, partial [Lactobacillus crispatus]|nr:transcriptional regulator [Lactobacillus crispatus]